MKKVLENRGAVVSVRARPGDAVARARRLQASIAERIASDLPLTDAQRDLLLVAVAQKLGIIF
jgi:hypothetical protein